MCVLRNLESFLVERRCFRILFSRYQGERDDQSYSLGRDEKNVTELDLIHNEETSVDLCQSSFHSLCCSDERSNLNIQSASSASVRHRQVSIRSSEDSACSETENLGIGWSRISDSPGLGQLRLPSLLKRFV